MNWQKIAVITLVLALLASVQPALIASDNYIGSKNCGHCHEAQYDAWKKGSHSGSLFVLDVEHRNSSKCISCHAIKIQGKTTSVECESCHGAGANYAKSYIMKDLELARAVGLKYQDYTVCLKCHQGDTPTVQEFEARKFWKRLMHSKTSNQ